ncbi:MAG: hypothetical protein AAGC81_08405 [Pseudomonadota bacterium]
MTDTSPASSAILSMISGISDTQDISRSERNQLRLSIQHFQPVDLMDWVRARTNTANALSREIVASCLTTSIA